MDPVVGWLLAFFVALWVGVSIYIDRQDRRRWERHERRLDEAMKKLRDAIGRLD